MKINLDGRLALVTGAARGNGAAIARGLAAAGARVVIADVLAPALADQRSQFEQSGLQVDAIELDVTSATACEQAAAAIAQRHGAVSILVNNAGILLRGRVTDSDIREKWQKTLDVNVQGPFNVTHALLGQLRATRGSIINIASIQSFVAPVNAIAYNVSKAAVAQFTRALASELAPDGVRVNAIAPGIIETAMTAPVREDAVRLEGFLRHVPMARVGRPDELIGPAVFLASELSSYVTGAVLPVDGGYLTV
jgi:NAD(P)-dependent dehydrogenase (short-subunit alcohol dehydrogenase family)